MRRPVLFLLLLPCLLALPACNPADEQGIIMAAGSYSDLAVVVGGPQTEPLARRFLDQVNVNTTFVIKEEPLFRPDVYVGDQLELVHRYKNVILILRIGDGGSLEKRVKGMISKETWQHLANGPGGMVQLNDPWATYQTVLIVAAGDRNSLGSFLRAEAATIRKIFEDSSRKRILRQFRYSGLDTRLMNAYREQFGFSFEIPKEFKQNQLKPEGFLGLELLRTGPSRGISVSWQPVDDPAAALGDQSFLLAMREAMGERMHNEEIVPEGLRWSTTTLGALPAVKLEGAWASTRFEGGGPFWCYFVADETRSRVLCVDLLAYAPHMDKMPMFRRMATIVSTFKLEN